MTLTISWAGDDVVVTIEIPSQQWARIESGELITIKGNGYWYEGEFFSDEWCFNTDHPGSLRVLYGSDGGEGFVGDITDADQSVR